MLKTLNRICFSPYKISTVAVSAGSLTYIYMYIREGQIWMGRLKKQKLRLIFLGPESGFMVQI